jgi:hypothetical protein
MPNLYGNKLDFGISTIAVIAAISGPILVQPDASQSGMLCYTSPTSVTAQVVTFYSAKAYLFESVQLAALQRFASKMLQAAEDLPPTAADLLNRHFWDLI